MKSDPKRDEVGSILETAYGIDINTVEKILVNSFRADQMPPWFLYSKSASELSQLLYVSSQVLNADTEHLSVTSTDGKEITYFINVGRDVPGKLRQILDENSGIDLISFDSVRIGSGRRIVTLEKRGRHELTLDYEMRAAVDGFVRKVREKASEREYTYCERFLAVLPPNYLVEEVKYDSRSNRIIRHMGLFEQVLKTRRVVFQSELISVNFDEEEEKRISIAVPYTDDYFPRRVLGFVRRHNLNLSRTFWDLFSDSTDPVGIISLYFPRASNLESLMADLSNELGGELSGESGSRVGWERDSEWELLIRGLSSPDCTSSLKVETLGKLKTMADRNRDLNLPGDELAGNLLLNALSDFFEASELVGLGGADAVLAELVAFERFDEFWVYTKEDGKRSNAEGFRVKHSTVRGPAKGGIRNAMIVDFAEVSGLSFLMTWKCARTGILFGGGKGGLKFDPEMYRENPIELSETLSSFGRALFHVTGPAEDVPAGDVGCGPVEIGRIFEGFKAALHDLAMIAGGVKKSGAVLGQKIVSLGEARRILRENYDVDVHDSALMSEMTSNEKFLELVAASHITGKPKMGIAARNGATGRGLCFAILATVANEYIAGKWESESQLNKAEISMLEMLTRIHSGGMEEKDWKAVKPVLTKLFRGKRVVVQGSGKVGSSLIRELGQYGVKFTAVADGGGAIVAQSQTSLDVDEILRSAREDATVTAYEGKSDKVIQGAREGSEVLKLDCDILVLAALENAITLDNVESIQARLIACGSNGPITPKARKVLFDRNITVIYDMLANSGGVTASYFEWLRNLSDRYHYEAAEIRGEEYDPEVMKPYIMPEYAERINSILSGKESDDTSKAWNELIRDIIITSINKDYSKAQEWSSSMKLAGYADAILKVLSARLITAPENQRAELWKKIPDPARKALVPYLNSQESELFNPEYRAIIDGLPEN